MLSIVSLLIQVGQHNVPLCMLSLRVGQGRAVTSLPHVTWF